MTKQRLDILMTASGLTTSRSQAESWIKLGKVTVDDKVQSKPGFFVHEKALIKLNAYLISVVVLEDLPTMHCNMVQKKYSLSM